MKRPMRPIDWQAAGEERSWHFRAPPRDTTRGAVAAIAIALVVAACCWRTLVDLQGALAALGVSGKGIVVLLVLLGIGALYPLVPAVRSVRIARQAYRAIKN